MERNLQGNDYPRLCLQDDFTAADSDTSVVTAADTTTLVDGADIKVRRHFMHIVQHLDGIDTYP